MTLSRSGHELVVVTIICVLGIFLFPAAAGPYPVVHGPVSALQAMQRAAKLRFAIALAALTVSAPALLNLRSAPSPISALFGLPLPESPGICLTLRC